MTKVVNIYKEPYDVYIGRAGKGKDGYFGNPIKLYSDTKSERNCVLKSFEIYFYSRILNDIEFQQRVLELKGKTLGCFCHPKAWTKLPFERCITLTIGFIKIMFNSFKQSVWPSLSIITISIIRNTIKL